MQRKTIQEWNQAYRRGEVQPTEVITSFLQRIKQNQALNCYLTVTDSLAQTQAEQANQQWSQANPLPPLLGIPLGYKDNLALRGYPTSRGSHLEPPLLCSQSADVIQRLEQSGSVTLGKHHLHEYALGVSSENPHWGNARNPWQPEYSPGGSSGGSAAAVAAYLCVAAIGTDTGGSIRIPASACGVVGLKPTHQRLSTHGAFPISPTLDDVGPIAANVSDLRSLWHVLTQQPSREPKPSTLANLRIGIPTDYFNQQIDTEVKQLTQQAAYQLQQLGAQLQPISLPDLSDNARLNAIIALYEAAQIHQTLPVGQQNYGQDVREFLAAAQQVSRKDYQQAMLNREALQHAFEGVFHHVDLLLTPTLPILPQPIGTRFVSFGEVQEALFGAMIRYTSVFNLLGLPALSLPCGVAMNGLPVGMQLVAAADAEDQLLDTALIYEKHCLTDFYRLRDQRCIK